MEDAEKRILKRKKAVFTDHVTISADLLSELHGRNLLDDNALETLMAEKVLNCRAGRLIDYILLTPQNDGFFRLCAALSRDYPWLSKELELDLRIERAEIDIDDDVMKEAAMLVHRKFGQSKRLSEVDKKDMQDLIAVKVQLAKEEWGREMDRLREQLNYQIELHKVKDEKAAAADRQVAAYIRQHNETLTTHAHDMKSTTVTLLTSINDRDIIMQLRARLDYLLDRMNFVIKNAEMLQQERERCLQLMNSRKESGKLYDIIERKMVELPAKIDLLSKDIKLKEEELKSIRKGVVDTESKLKVQDGHIETLEQQILHKDARASILEDKVRELEMEISDMTERLARTAVRKKSAGSKPRK